jgi:hypothetical protein
MPKSATVRIPSKGRRKPDASARSTNARTAVKRPKDLLSLSREEQALRRLNLTSDELERVERSPAITPLLKTSEIGHEAAIAILRYSFEPVATVFLACYDRLPKGDREVLPIEVIGVRAGVGMLELLGAIMLAAKSKIGQESALLAITSHPAVLKKTIEYAELPGGIQDRRLLHEAVNFVPGKKGFNMNFHFGAQPAKEASTAPAVESEEDEDEDENPDFNNLFPMVTDRLEEWGDMRNRLLEAPK